MIEELELVDNELEIVDAPVALSPMLQSIARNYLGARMRAGDAILESARYLAEARNAAQHGEWYVFLAAVQTSQDAADRLLAIHAESERSPRFAEAMRTNFLTVSSAYELTTAPPAVQDRLLTQETPPTRAQIRDEKRAANPAPARDLNQSAPDPPPSEDEQYAETIRAILKEAEDKGERTGTRLYQQAYDYAREIHDVTLYNKMIALIDRETDTPPPPSPTPRPASATVAAYDAKERDDRAILTEVIGLLAAARGLLSQVKVSIRRRDQVAADVATEAARAFVLYQRERLTRFSPAAMISQATFTESLGHTEALLDKDKFIAL